MKVADTGMALLHRYLRKANYSLSYNSPNAIRYVFMAIAGQ
ncbi:hypothetical protein [Wolbachia endosymbiont (group A) of Scambus nigricans]|nr:hypothetical protein [Wolbachia endosymbiont (group A) of Scambus nigricans]